MLRNTMTISPEVLIRSLLLSAGFGSIIQTVPVGDAGSAFITNVGKLGLDGFLGIVVWKLWVKLNDTTKDRDDQIAKKDELLLKLYQDMASVMATNKATLEKMGSTLEHMDEVLCKMDNVRQAVQR